MKRMIYCPGRVINPRLRIIILSFFSGLLFLSCPKTLSYWTESAKIKDASFTVTGVPDFFYYVELEGIPPFVIESFNNPFFEGAALGSVTVDQTEIVNLYTLNPSFLGSLAQEEPFFLRIKSNFSEWRPYSDPTGNPKIVIYHNTGNAANDVATPVLLSSRQDLIDLANQADRFKHSGGAVWDRIFILTSDIDLTGYVWHPIGNSSTAFTGTFNGLGHVISGINGFDTTTSSSVGFFGIVGGGSIKNLGLELGDIDVGTTPAYVGGLAGLLNPGPSTVSNCFVKGIRLRGGNNSLGGLVGYMHNNSSVTNSYSDIVIEGSGSTGIGGIAGSSGVGTMSFSNSYAAGDVFCNGNSTAFVGGAIGTHTAGTNPSGSIALNKRVQNINGGTGAIRFFGNSDSSIGLFETYYNKEMISPGGISLFGSVPGSETYSVPVNPYTMSQNTPPFSTWDFTNTWKWDDSINRPVLRTVRIK